MSDIPKYVKSEIYMIINKITEKYYIGQTRTHVLNHGKYRLFGSEKRFQAHVSEAIGNYAKQSTKLNNAIRKYGKDSFEVKVLHICDIRFANHFEKCFIAEYNSIIDGYNITPGGDHRFHGEEQKQQISDSLIEYNLSKKIDKFYGLDIEKVKLTWRKEPDKDIIYVLAYIENHEHYGVNRCMKVDFGGRKCRFEDTVKRVQDFLEQIILLSEKYISLPENLKPYIQLDL